MAKKKNRQLSHAYLKEQLIEFRRWNESSSGIVLGEKWIKSYLNSRSRIVSAL